MAGGYQSWPLIQFGVIGEAWRLYKRHWLLWSLAMLIVLTCYGFVAGVLVSFLGINHLEVHGGYRLFLTPGRHTVSFVLSNVIVSFFLGGMIRMASRQVRGQEPRLEDLFSVTDVWFDLALVAFLYGVVSSLAYMLCVIPGLIVAGLNMLAIPLVVEGGMPATGAIIRSWNALKSQWLVAALFHTVLILASMSGAMLCGIGLLLTGPLYCLAIATLYRDFFGSAVITTWAKSPEPFPDF